ncbi:MAG: hypothetical protein ACOCVH_01855 [Verrucomicrobiota bacterium]
MNIQDNSKETTFTLESVEIQQSRINIRWKTDPASKLYRRTNCSLVFPEEVNLHVLPAGLVERTVLMLLYPHWAILAPCKIKLPFKIHDGERLAWSRLAENQWNSVQFHSGRKKEKLKFSWDYSGEMLSRSPAPVNGEGCATAFSGGKDSLFQTGFLMEQGESPLLVTTIAPPPEVHPRRLYVYDQVQHRTGLPLIKVQTDYRSSCHNLYPREQGLTQAVNELTDVLLYTACLILAAAVKNINRLYVASELEVQTAVKIDETLVTHPHAMYNVTTLKTLQRILEPYNISISSLTAPLQTMQIQQTLWKEWPKLRDMQTSCWSMTPDEPMCNKCGQCLRITLCSLEAGFDPAEMGGDAAKNLAAVESWKKIRAAAENKQQLLPDTITRQLLYRQTLHATGSIGLPRLFFCFLKKPSYVLHPVALWKAACNTIRLWALSRNVRMPELGTFADAFLDFVDKTEKNNLRSFLEERYSAGRQSHPGNRFSQYTLEAIDWCTEELK